LGVDLVRLREPSGSASDPAHLTRMHDDGGKAGITQRRHQRRFQAAGSLEDDELWLKWPQTVNESGDAAVFIAELPLIPGLPDGSVQLKLRDINANEGRSAHEMFPFESPVWPNLAIRALARATVRALTRRKRTAPLLTFGLEDRGESSRQRRVRARPARQRDAPCHRWLRHLRHPPPATKRTDTAGLRERQKARRRRGKESEESRPEGGVSSPVHAAEGTLSDTKESAAATIAKTAWPAAEAKEPRDPRFGVSYEVLAGRRAFR